MLFTSLTFLIFHVVVVALRWALPARAAGPLLLVSSYVFYLSWEPKYGLLIFSMTLVTWLTALGLEGRRTDKRRLLAAIVAALLVVLGYFKYAHFLVAQGTSLLSVVGLGAAPRSFEIVLPLAISFYTFELISYVIDVYRGEAAERSLLRFALYVSYYPHLIAGPIVRAHELLPNLRQERRFDADLFAEGVFIALVGYVKKTIFADNFSPWSDAVFAAPEKYSTFGVWMGVLAYTGQIFCDFSGYTDIARGASMMLGYELPENFDTPYLSRSPTEFWRRWHMTLSRWLRDYLYISLGGNRKGARKQYRNLLLTMILGGLWHGASWTFVAWGALHGAGLAVHKLWDTVLGKLAWSARLRKSLPYGVVAWAMTFVFVMIGWVCFRAPTFGNAAAVLARMFTSVRGLGELAAAGELPKALRLVLMLAALLAVGQGLGRARVPLALHRRSPAVIRGAVWAALIAACFLFAEARAEFIYFQF